MPWVQMIHLTKDFKSWNICQIFMKQRHLSFVVSKSADHLTRLNDPCRLIRKMSMAIRPNKCVYVISKILNDFLCKVWTCLESDDPAAKVEFYNQSPPACNLSLFRHFNDFLPHIYFNELTIRGRDFYSLFLSPTE